MIIDQSKTYRTRDGREVRIYAMDGAVVGAAGAIHGAIKSAYGWECTTWFPDGVWARGGKSDGDLIESDPHGILPRHRELLAEAYEGLSDGVTHFNGSGLVSGEFYSLAPLARAALIALARLDGERGE